jgi:hypothetical protein
LSKYGVHIFSPERMESPSLYRRNREETRRDSRHDSEESIGRRGCSWLFRLTGCWICLVSKELEGIRWVLQQDSAPAENPASSGGTGPEPSSGAIGLCVFPSLSLHGSPFVVGQSTGGMTCRIG